MLFQKNNTHTYLKVFQKKDIIEMARLANNINIAKWVRGGFPHPYTRLDGERFFQACKEEKKNAVYSVFWEKRFTGLIGIVHHEGGASIEIGYWVGEEYWGKGIATEAVGQLILLLFKNKKVKTLTAEVIKNNTGSIRVLEKNGFVKTQEINKTCNSHNSDPVYLYVLKRSSIS